MKIAIIGAGLVGLNTAHRLADEGHEVTIIDRVGPANGASRGNAGMIAHNDIEPLASPRMLRKVPQMLLDPLSPLAIRPAYAVQIFPWLVRLLAASTPANLKRSIDAIIAIQSLSRPAWAETAKRLDLHSFFHERGSLYLFDNQQTYQAARDTYAHQRALGIHVDELNADEIRQMEPALNDKIIAAGYFPDAGHISDPRLLTEILFARAMERGIPFLKDDIETIAAGDHVTITGPDHRHYTFDRAVIAAGAWSKPLATQLGDTIPLDTERGYNISFPGVTGLLNRPVSFQGYGFVATPMETGLRIGGAVELGGLKLQPNHARTRALYARAQNFVKGLPAYETGTEWMGFRPSLPDSLPVIGRAKASPNVLYAFGHGHYGLTQSAATAGLLADLIAGRPTPIDLAPFAPDRF